MKGDVEKGYWERGCEGGVESEGLEKRVGIYPFPPSK